MKLPYIDLYPGDWLKDAVAGCSLAAQGLWIRLMFIMQESPKRGYLIQFCLSKTLSKNPVLVGTTFEVLAKRCGCDLAEFNLLFDELVAAGVPSKGEDGIWFSRRMVKDEALRKVRSKAGKAGGKASVESRFAQPNRQPNVGLDWVGTNSVPKGGMGENGIGELTHRINTLFKRDKDFSWSYEEQHALHEVSKRPNVRGEFLAIEKAMGQKVEFMSQSVAKLLTDWTKNLDRANNFKPKNNGGNCL